ncbi:erythromycin esterase family protein [Nocardia terpenica]|uniref:erythromycin esterase family protein n=1 Tax=Nocardia terpenica TaxID=455432 RepID=UPI002B4AE9C3|nr:erythromycin esterase family protein [Nocardia terpenica]
MASAPSPRRYLEFARDYLKLDIDLAGLAGDDDRWSRTEAIMDPAASIGATPEAEQLRVIADDMLTMLYARAPELIAVTSRAAWFTAETHLTAGLGLLRYHKQSADRQPDETTRVSRMLAVRDALMAQNLLAIHRTEAPRGATFVFAQNGHLRRNPSNWRLAGMDLTWFGAGAIIASLLDNRYRFVAGSLGRSAALGLTDPTPDTYEGILSSRITTWGLTTPAALGPGRTRTDTHPEQDYFPSIKQRSTVPTWFSTSPDSTHFPPWSMTTARRLSLRTSCRRPTGRRFDPHVRTSCMPLRGRSSRRT